MKKNLLIILVFLALNLIAMEPATEKRLASVISDWTNALREWGEIERTIPYGDTENFFGSLAPELRSEVFKYLYAIELTLEYAITSGNYNIIELITRPGINLNFEFKSGKTPLTLLMQEVNENNSNDLKKIIELFAANGADLNKKDRLGYTPLMAAVQNNNVWAIEVLLSGENIKQPIAINEVSLINGKQTTALDLAKNSNFKGSPYIMMLLIGKGAKTVADLEAKKGCIISLKNKQFDLD